MTSRCRENVSTASQTVGHLLSSIGLASVVRKGRSANTRHSANVGLMMAYHLRRWSNNIGCTPRVSLAAAAGSCQCTLVSN